MRKQQEQTLLSELIKASEIYKSIEELETVLKSYQRLSLIQKEAYNVRLEFIALNKELALLVCRLDGIIGQSKIWEAK